MEIRIQGQIAILMKMKHPRVEDDIVKEKTRRAVQVLIEKEGVVLVQGIGRGLKPASVAHH